MMRRLLLAALIALPAMAHAQIAGGVGATVDQSAGAAANVTAPIAAAPAHAAQDEAGGKAVTVQAGARIQVDRSTRCTDGTAYYDPYYQPDGHYYCEPRGPGLATTQPK